MSRVKPSLRQVAALPLRRIDRRTEVLLVTSRETGRWVIPKGWPMPRRNDWDAAAQEALEEAGVKGEVSPDPVGGYTYFKRRAGHFEVVDVVVYPLDVTKQLKNWRERKQRKTRWVPLPLAAELVYEPGLKSLLLEFESEAPAAA